MDIICTNSDGKNRSDWIWLKHFSEITHSAHRKTYCHYLPQFHQTQGNSVARDLPPTGSEANTTFFCYIYWI